MPSSIWWTVNPFNYTYFKCLRDNLFGDSELRWNWLWLLLLLLLLLDGDSSVSCLPLSAPWDSNKKLVNFFYPKTKTVSESKQILIIHQDVTIIYSSYMLFFFNCFFYLIFTPYNFGIVHHTYRYLQNLNQLPGSFISFPLGGSKEWHLYVLHQ